MSRVHISRQITTVQVAAILVSTIIGVGVLPLPLFAVDAADSGAPLVTFLGMVVAMIGVWILAMLGKRFPNQTIIQYSEELIGTWLARVGSVFIIMFFAILTALTAREFGEVVVTSVLKTTPVEVTVIVMLLLAAFSTRNDITTFAYIHNFYFPILLVPAILIIVLSLKNADVINLLPIWGNEPKGMGTGAMTIAALFQGSFILTAVIPAMRRPGKVIQASMVGMLIAGGLYISIVAATVSVFGAEEIKELLWPTLELAKTTSLPANVLERLDAAFLAIWVTAVFTTLLSSYFLTIHSMGKLFRLREHRLFSFFLLPIVFVLAMLPKNILHMYEVIQIVGRIGLVITLGYPALLLVISLLRRKRGEPVGEQTKEKRS